MKLNFDLNALKYDFPFKETATKSYLIAAIPRSGSTLLSRLLGNTGHAGMPREYLFSMQKSDYETRWGQHDMPLDRYLARLMQHRTSPNGVFGLKAHYHQYESALLNGGHSFEDFLPQPRYIFLTRHNRVRQAISWVKAIQTGQWRSDTRAERQASYDYEAIKQQLSEIVRMENAWENLFRQDGIQPLRLRFENLVADKLNTVRLVLEFIGISEQMDHLTGPDIRPLANKESEEWEKRFRGEYRLMQRFARVVKRKLGYW